MVQPDGWRIRHIVVVATGGATRTGTNPTALERSARRRLPITPLRTNARLIQVHWCMLICLSRQYCEKLTPSFFASSRWARHARSRSLKPSRFRSDIVLSTSAATAPRCKASPAQITAKSTGLLEWLLLDSGFSPNMECNPLDIPPTERVAAITPIPDVTFRL